MRSWFPRWKHEPAFAERFFSRLRLMFNAAAALPAGLRDRLSELAGRTAGCPIPVTGSWGATETAPAVTTAHFDFADARCIGVPLPGAVVKLVPAEDAYEIRVKGPMVTPGYFERPDLTAEAFDEDGFYRTGDAVEPADPADPDAGLVFRGRIAEDFKLRDGHVRARGRCAYLAPVSGPRLVRRGDHRREPGLRVRARLAQRRRDAEAPGCGS